MKTLNPIFFREIYTLPRQKYFYIKRMAMVSLPFLFLANQIIDSSFDTSGLQIFRFYAYFSFIALVILSIMLTLPLIIKERENNTLILLLLTKMSPLKIVGGKFASNFFFLCLIYAAFLPLGIFVISLGGISSPQIKAVFIVTIGSIALSIALTILLGLILSSRNAFVAIAISIFIGEQALSYLAPQLSPLLAIQNCLKYGKTSSCYYSFLFLFSLTSFFLSLSAYLLSEETKWSKAFSHHEPIHKEKKTSTVKPSFPITKNPVYWRDYYCVYGLHKLKWIFSLCLSLLARSIDNRSTLASIWIPLILITLFLIFYQCINAFRQEKQNKTWELLTLTGLVNHSKTCSLTIK